MAGMWCDNCGIDNYDDEVKLSSDGDTMISVTEVQACGLINICHHLTESENRGLHATVASCQCHGNPQISLDFRCFYTDGVTRSGLFCAVCDVISRVTYDKEVDVYITVRTVQDVIPQAVTSVVQYRFCYEAVQRRISDLSVYANTG